MDGFFSLKYGIGGVCVLLTIAILLQVAKFMWSMKKEKETLSESAVRELTRAVQANTAATQHLDHRIGSLERAASEFPKFKTDIRRFYAAIKEVAGEKWPKIRDEIMKDEFTI